MQSGQLSITYNIANHATKQKISTVLEDRFVTECSYQGTRVCEMTTK